MVSRQVLVSLLISVHIPLMLCQISIQICHCTAYVDQFPATLPACGGDVGGGAVKTPLAWVWACLFCAPSQPEMYLPTFCTCKQSCLSGTMERVQSSGLPAPPVLAAGVYLQ